MLSGHTSIMSFLWSEDDGREEMTDSKSTKGMARMSTSDSLRKASISNEG